MSIFDLFKEYSDVNRTIIFKIELLRQGVKFSEKALKTAQDIDTAFKGFFLEGK